MSDVKQYRDRMRQLFKNLDLYAGVGFVTTDQFKKARDDTYEEMNKIVLEWSQVLEDSEVITERKVPFPIEVKRKNAKSPK